MEFLLGVFIGFVIFSPREVVSKVDIESKEWMLEQKKYCEKAKELEPKGMSKLDRDIYIVKQNINRPDLRFCKY